MTLLKREACHLPAHANCVAATADSKETSEVTVNFQTTNFRGHAMLVVDEGCSPEAAFGQTMKIEDSASKTALLDLCLKTPGPTLWQPRPPRPGLSSPIS